MRVLPTSGSASRPKWGNEPTDSTSPISPIRFHARFFIARAEALQGELAELGYYPVTEVLAHMPIVDVTEFMLNRATTYAAAPDRFNPITPVFSYKGEVPFVNYE